MIKVLIVEDEKNQRELLASSLKDDYETVTAASGKEAFETFSSDRSIGIVISDFKMEGMDGIELLKKVKKLDPNIIFILITAYASVPCDAKGEYPLTITVSDQTTNSATTFLKVKEEFVMPCWVIWLGWITIGLFLLLLLLYLIKPRKCCKAMNHVKTIYHMLWYRKKVIKYEKKLRPI